jgi:hypothetical protein
MMRAIACLGLATVLAACQPLTPPKPFVSQAQPGPTCLPTCDKEYKECANGSTCMMTAQCDMEVCIPRKQDCQARCSDGR